MRPFSRWMSPPSRGPMGLSGWLTVAGLFAEAVGAAVAWPHVCGGLVLATFAAAAIMVMMHLCISPAANRYLRRLAAARVGEDIGTFARAFDRRTEPFDPWVVRATWDALQPYVSFRGGHVPLRPTDRLVEDLCVDPDDIFFELLPTVVARAGHSLDHAPADAPNGPVETVGDFVRFITFLPRVSKGELGH